MKSCLNDQKPLFMNCPIQRFTTPPPAWNSWLRALWWNSWFVVDITALAARGYSVEFAAELLLQAAPSAARAAAGPGPLHTHP